MIKRGTTGTLILPPLPFPWRTSPRLQEIGTWVAAAVLGYATGASVASDARARVLLLLLIPFLVLVLTIRPEKLVVGWVFAAPLVQGASSGTNYGHRFYQLIFLVPPLILIARMALGGVRIRGLWVIDALPALYLAYILLSARVFPSEFTAPERATVTSVYITVGVGITAYYVAAFLETPRRFPQMIAGSFVWSGVVVAVLALVDGLAGWNLWHHVVVNGDIRRAVSTFTSPADLGAYLGASIAFAVAVLVLDGPRSLKLPSLLLLSVGLPAFYFTFTRGPVLAIAAVAGLMAVVGRRSRWPSVLVFASVGILVFAALGQITSSTVYKDRFGVDTVAPRVVLTDVAMELFHERPLLGHGYATFDQVKRTVPVAPRNVEIVESTTSHDTFLTVLAETGLVGLTLLVLPWIVIGWRAVAAAWRGRVEPWIVGGCVGAAATFVIGATTYDARFFALASALPWITLGLARNALGDREASSEPAAQGATAE